MELFPKKTDFSSELFGSDNIRRISLREELHRLLHGTEYSPGIGRWVVLRKFNTNKVSEQYYEPTGEGIGGPKWDYTDICVRTYSYYLRSSRGEQMSPVGRLNIPVIIFYLEWTTDPKPEDIIYEIPHNTERNAPFINPSTYGRKYDIKQVEPKYGDNGRIEFYQVISWRDVT